MAAAVRPRARDRLAATRRTPTASSRSRASYGADAHLIDNEGQVEEEWLEGKRVVGITSGASAPEELVQRLVDFFRARGTEQVEEFEVVQEDVRFMLPKTIRQALAAAQRRPRPKSSAEAGPSGSSGVSAGRQLGVECPSALPSWAWSATTVLALAGAVAPWRPRRLAAGHRLLRRGDRGRRRARPRGRARGRASGSAARSTTR